MSHDDNQKRGTDREMIESVWAEARDLIQRLEGSSVLRLAVAAGDYKIEIERGASAAPTSAPDWLAGKPNVQAPSFGIPSAGGRGASGIFTFEPPPDRRTPVLAPLVGTFYRAPQPGAKPFVEVGDRVDAGQTVCIVEAMKMMNEVCASEAGTVAEIAVENGEWVEFEQVLVYLEQAEE
jgi:acetyl-CoA carboxylase biotin carboxyl carrier protein